MDQFGLICPTVWGDQFVDLIMRGFGSTLWRRTGRSVIGTEPGIEAVQFIADSSNSTT